jgi:hypothetical protein
VTLGRRVTTTLAPLRRSLQERILESSCRLCTRRIHSYNYQRAPAAAAQVQQNAELGSRIESILQEVNWAKSSEKEAQKAATASKSTAKSPTQSKSAKKSPKKTFKSPASPSKGNITKARVTPEPKKKKIKEKDPETKPSNISSQPVWNRERILEEHPTPPENLLPRKVTVHRGGKKREFDWKKDPRLFIEEGLKLSLKTEVHEEKRPEHHVHAKIHAKWCKYTCTAVGAGANKVTYLISTVYTNGNSKQLSMLRHCIS